MMVLGVARLTLPVEGDLGPVAGLDVAVDTVVADIQPAAHEPFGERQVPLEGLLPRFGPAERSSVALPERHGISGRSGVYLLLGVRGLAEKSVDGAKRLVRGAGLKVIRRTGRSWPAFPLTRLWRPPRRRSPVEAYRRGARAVDEALSAAGPGVRPGGQAWGRRTRS